MAWKPMKEVLGGGGASKTTIFPRSYYDEQRIALRLDTRANAFDAQSKRVSPGDGTTLDYDHRVLATGVRARHLATAGARLDGVMTLRTLDDSARLSARLTGRAKVVVIGGGFLGLEIAAAAVMLGCAVSRGVISIA